MATECRPGDWFRHFKGGVYRVVAMARHHETKEELVVYEGFSGTWVRPAKEFLGYTKDGSRGVRRFMPVTEREAIIAALEYTLKKK